MAVVAFDDFCRVLLVQRRGHLRPSDETSDFVWVPVSRAVALVRSPHVARITRAARHLGIAVDR